MSDIIIELPFNQVKIDCFKVIQQIFGIDLNDHNIVFKLNQPASWFDLPNEINLRCSDFATNPDIILIWHEIGHYLNSLQVDLEKLDPLHYELLPMVCEELCIWFYNLQFNEYRDHELQKYIALGMIDQALVEMEDVTQEKLYSLIEEVQNFTQVNITTDDLEVISDTIYSGNYNCYVYARNYAKHWFNNFINSVNLKPI